LSNFRRGCLVEEQTFRIGASATAIEQFILPALADACSSKRSPRYAVESVDDDEVERRLHDLTLDFGVVTKTEISRPLQLKAVGTWRLFLWTPRPLCSNERRALAELKAGRLPLIIPAKEMPQIQTLTEYRPHVVCNSFLEAQAVLETDSLAAFLPSFLKPERNATSFIRTHVRGVTTKRFHYRFAWNPRLLRLNPHAIRARDSLTLH
jgi:DNA-binding transcriptional LysR family regulator